jgi:hypothetical protein
MSPILGIMASQISGHLETGAFESIATVNGTGSSATITFSSIPATFKHLQVRWLAKDTYTSSALVRYLGVRINGVTTSTYSQHYLRGDGATASATGAANTGYMNFQGGTVTSGTGMSDIFGVGILDILDYTDTTKTKPIRTIGGGDINASGGYIYLSSGLSASTSAVTSIELLTPLGFFTSTSTFALYGIKGA